MNPSLATVDAMTVAAKAPNAVDARLPRRPDATQDLAHAAHERSSESRMSHVFRTLGRGLVAEYDPA